MEKLGTILAVDDNPAFLGVIVSCLENDYQVFKTTDPTSAVRLVGYHKPEVVLLDVDMPELDGLVILQHLHQKDSKLPIIMLTAQSQATVVVKAMRSGAFDYVVKDDGFEELLRIKIAAAVRMAGLRKAKEDLSSRIEQEKKQYEIIGNSPAVTKLKSEITCLKGTNATVLITGENGTGKELVARNLNLQEKDSSRKIINVNCGGITSTLFESEVFGHVKGAFTGATENKKGFFVEADGGDIFLDEIGELSLETQAKLLRTLQERVVMPVGSHKEIPVDVRIIAATNRNLEDMVRNGTFREDLYFRLNQIKIRVPSLRERFDDIVFLAQAFAKKRIPGVKFSKEAMETLERHPWPGNIRELDNTVERACILLQGSLKNRIEREHLKIGKVSFNPNQLIVPKDLVPVNPEDISPWSFRQALDWMEKIYLEKSIEVFRGDNRQIIERLGISRSQYFKRKKELSLLDSQGEGA